MQGMVVPFTLKVQFFFCNQMFPEKNIWQFMVKVSKIQRKISSSLCSCWISSIILASGAKTAHARDLPLWKCNPRDEFTLHLGKHGDL